jgi:hypothetical protein
MFCYEISIVCLLCIDFENYFELLVWLIDQLLEITQNFCCLQMKLWVRVHKYNEHRVPTLLQL